MDHVKNNLMQTAMLKYMRDKKIQSLVHTKD